MTVLSLAEARRIALAAQGFDRARPSRPVTAKDLAAVIRRLGLVQIDYVNVLVPAQYVIPFSRLGPYDRSLFDRLVFESREFTEQWAHEASIVPVSTWPLLRHRMDEHRVRPWGFETFLTENPAYVERILTEVRARPGITADELPAPESGPRRIPGAWHSSIPRAVLEAHFGRGLLAVAARRPNFARVYDLAERIIPAEHHARKPERADAERELLRQAARAHGIGTAADLADYFRMPIRTARARLAELVESNELKPVRVEGWKEPAFLHPEAARPRRIDATALLSPFDPVVWYRPRALRLFEFDYRIEIWVPQEQRRWGYYVLPFLEGDRLTARVDLKADRAARRLHVLASYIEPHAAPEQTADALARELQTLAAWLGLESVAVSRRGGLARTLAGALRAR